MRDQIVMVEAAFDAQQAARDILAEHVQLQDVERALDVVDQKATGLRQRQAQHRLELGRLLTIAKNNIKHGGWLPYLEKLGIPQRSANDWMTKSADLSKPADLTTHAQDGTGKHKPKSEPKQKSADPDPDRDTSDNEPENDISQRRAQHAQAKPIDIDRELLTLHQKVMSSAKTWSANGRQALAHELRSMAEQIEEMQDD